MNKLLSAGFARLWKSRLLQMEILAAVLAAWLVMQNAARYILEEPDVVYSVDEELFQISPLIGLFIAVFASLFIGTEYSDGALRNKIVVGAVRRNIYLTNAVVVFVSSALVLLAWFAAGLAAGTPLLGKMALPVPQLIIYLLVLALAAGAAVGIFTMVAMLCDNKAVCPVATIMLFFGLLFIASRIYNELSAPEMISTAMFTVDETIRITDPQPNPAYIGGVTRSIYEIVLDILPTGQGIQLANIEEIKPLRMAVSSVAIMVISTAAGIRFFKHKDIK